MRFLAVSLAALVTLAAAPSVGAEGIQNFLTGLNGILTFPADPVAQVILPPEKLEDMPGYEVTGRIAGLFGGTVQATSRVLGGAYDLVLCPVLIPIELAFRTDLGFPVFSPEPRYELIPWIEYEEF